jgi:hypothetical protein
MTTPGASEPTEGESSSLDGDASAPSATPGASRTGASRFRRRIVVGVLAAVVLLLVPGGVFAWRALDGGGPQPHDVLPANAIGYFRIDLDPSASQKIDAFRFLRKFPALTDAIGGLDEDDDLRERVIDSVVPALECDIDFASDIKPWIGDRLGGAILPSSDEAGAPGFALALQVRDHDASETAMRKIQDCGEGGPEAFGWAYLNGYLIITDTRDNAQRYVASAQKSSLGDKAQFNDAMDLLGDPGIASVWASSADLAKTMGDLFALSAPYGQETASSQLFGMNDLSSDTYGDIAFALRFNDSFAEIASVVTGDKIQALDGGVKADVPDTTTVLLGLKGGNAAVDQAWDHLNSEYPSALDEFKRTADEIGISLPEDLQTALGESLLLAFDGHDMQLDNSSEFEGISSLQLGLKVVTDGDAARDVWEKVQKSAADEKEALDGLPVDFTDDGYVIATNDGYLSKLLEHGNLAESDVYRTAIPDAEDADDVFFINVDPVEDDVLDLLREQGVGDNELESLRALGALGFSVHVHDGYVESALRITAN